MRIADTSFVKNKEKNILKNLTYRVIEFNTVEYIRQNWTDNRFAGTSRTSHMLY